MTRNRSNSLERTLNSLRKQSTQPFEVIISDDSSERFHLERNQALAKKFECKYLFGPQRGLYANRNHVAMACAGTHVRTMDDDHEFPLDHFNIVNQWFERYPYDVLVIGEVSANCSDKEVEFLIPGQLNPRGFSEPPKNIEEYYGISCGGTIYPKKIFDSGYLMCDSFLFGLAYLEFGSLLKSKGVKLRYISDTYIIHYFEKTNLREDHIVIPSMLFAIICHSWFYHPSNKNKILCLFQIVNLLLKRRTFFFGDFHEAFSAVKNRLIQIRRLPALCG